MLLFFIIAQAADPTGLPTWLAGGGVLTIISGLWLRRELMYDSLQKEFRGFITTAAENQYKSIATLEQALKVLEKTSAK